jgi:hypothetical protein
MPWRLPIGWIAHLRQRSDPAIATVDIPPQTIDEFSEMEPKAG